MDLAENIIQSEVTQTQKNTTWSLLFVDLNSESLGLSVTWSNLQNQ